MIARRLLSTSLVAGVLALATPLVAQKPASAPKNATAQCKDSTYSTAKTEQGACSQHGGVKTWWGPLAPAPTPSASKSKSPAAAAPQSAGGSAPNSATG